ncbi:MAG: ATP cone domain-containing protein [Elusimicrobiota bacterium]
MDYLFPEKEITKLKIDRIIKRDGRTVAFDRNKIVDSIFRAVVDVGGSDRKTAEALANTVISVINRTYARESIPSVEEIQDIVEKVLVEKGHYRTAKAYILYRAEHARIREEKNTRIVAEDNIPYKMLWRAYKWNVDHGCDTVENINKQTAKDGLKKLVVESEKLYGEEIEKVADKISAGKSRIRMVIVAGPSSSGKTTTTIKIGEQLHKKKLKFILLNLDNYFKDLDEHPKDEYGDHDFEAPEALDLELVNEHLYKLLKGDTVKMPLYDFKTGKRTLNAAEFAVKDDEILLIDSLHGLYPQITSSVPHEMKFKFYIETLCQLRDSNGDFMRWADLRMLRRMVRDSWHRAYRPEQTVGHWHYVRRSEKKNIVPFINKADYVFNGSLAYELPVYKKHLFDVFPAIIQKYGNDPKKLDALIRAERVYKLLEEVGEFKDEAVIPKNSLIREFIGGSSYKY